ncbi:UNVERIFIED_CONTAM: hypothetical protein Slati_2675400 [Sesamum latifolium]|uniref:Retrotransposon gag domain-containing protein n=1 Tax=Sesamum latifolium TaxID=2727402 RepID=A0AAW2VYD6_9LAMI
MEEENLKGSRARASRESPTTIRPRRGEDNRRPGEQERAPPPPMLQLTLEALRQLIEDASAQAAPRVIAHLAIGNSERGPANQQENDQLEEEVESRLSLLEDELPHLLKGDASKREGAQREKRSQGNPLPRSPSPMRAGGSQSARWQSQPQGAAHLRLNPHTLVGAIQPGIKISNLSEYNGVGDTQDHLDRFLTRPDLLESVMRPTTSYFEPLFPERRWHGLTNCPKGRSRLWFNHSLSQRFLHNFTINKRYPKIASYLFTIVQREHERLRGYVQRFSEAVLEVSHMDPKLLASIMQQNLRSSRFKESISRKPPATKEELLARAEKYIRIEETAGTRLMTPMKRRSAEEEGVMPPNAEGSRRERKHMLLNNLTHCTPFSVPRAEILAIAKQ